MLVDGRVCIHDELLCQHVPQIVSWIYLSGRQGGVCCADCARNYYGSLFCRSVLLVLDYTFPGYTSQQCEVYTGMNVHLWVLWVL